MVSLRCIGGATRRTLATSDLVDVATDRVTTRLQSFATPIRIMVMPRSRSAANPLSTDRRLADAIAHWKPRFTANGVAPSDFERITREVESWEQWCSAWSAVAAEPENLGRVALSENRTRSAGAHLAQASVYYHFAKFVFVEDLQQMRAAHHNAVR